VIGGFEGTVVGYKDDQVVFDTYELGRFSRPADLLFKIEQFQSYGSESRQMNIREAEGLNITLIDFSQVFSFILSLLE